ncbi:MAG: cupin domain-containing protein [Elusimicrobia bacterium]|nr:cupin domain-containing protein [Elusimicrobiota bacterium]
MKATWLDSGLEIFADKLMEEGIYYQKISTENFQPSLDKIKKSWGYSAQDIVELYPAMPNLDAICAKFDKEHTHTDDEVRFVLNGEGYFDIRSKKDQWMHLLVEKGDFILVPANRNHLFYLTPIRTIQCARLFKENPSWTPIYREKVLTIP